MGSNEKLLALRRADDLRRKRIEEAARRDRANAVDAETIRGNLRRVESIDNWERRRLDQAVEIIRLDALKKRSGNLRGLKAAVEQMRSRGETLAQIAALAGRDVREVQAALRRAQTDGAVRAVSKDSSSDGPKARRIVKSPAEPTSVHPLSNGSGGPSDEPGLDAYDPTRCVRCDAVMLDEEATSRRGRRRLYCSDTCRRDASSARMAAERYGAPIRVVEVPNRSPREQPGPAVESSDPVAHVDVVNAAMGDAAVMCELLAWVSEQARLRKLDRATLRAARDLSNAVHPQRDW